MNERIPETTMTTLIFFYLHFSSSLVKIETFFPPLKFMEPLNFITGLLGTSSCPSLGTLGLAKGVH